MSLYIYMYIYTVVCKTSYIYTSLSNLPIPNLGCYPPEQRVNDDIKSVQIIITNATCQHISSAPV